MADEELDEFFQEGEESQDDDLGEEMNLWTDSPPVLEFLGHEYVDCPEESDPRTGLSPEARAVVDSTLRVRAYGAYQPRSPDYRVPESHRYRLIKCRRCGQVTSVPTSWEPGADPETMGKRALSRDGLSLEIVEQVRCDTILVRGILDT
jgi:hypothetical protein